VPVGNVRLVYLGYQEKANQNADRRGFASLKDLAGHEFFTRDERKTLEEGEPKERNRTLAAALQSAYGYQEGAISLLLLPEEQEQWEDGDRDTRDALFEQAYWRLHALIQVVPELLDPASQQQRPADCYELRPEALTEKIKAAAGRIRCRPRPRR